VRLVGDEGTLGISLILGVDTSSLKAMVQISGAALSMEAAPFRRELEQNLALRHRQVAKVPMLRSPESPFGGGNQRVRHVERHGSDYPVLGTRREFPSGDEVLQMGLSRYIAAPALPDELCRAGILRKWRVGDFRAVTT
jgi:hypothetical protein